jgi:Transposase DDE domain
MSALDVEVVLAAAYGGVLLAAAVVLDLLARHSNARADRYRTGGFRFHAHLDAWECPEGEHLHLRERDHGRGVARYRARAHVCNACPAKPACTDSDDGRELVRSLDAWPRSEAGRFHRGISLALVVLAALIAAVVLLRHHELAEVALLAAVLVATALVARALVAELRTASSEPRVLA